MTATISFDTQATEKSILVYRERAQAIQVRNAHEYAAALLLVKDIRAQMKQIELILDPFIEAAKQSLSKARTEKDKYIGPLVVLDGAVSAKAELWRSEERRRAQEEEIRLNAERQREAERVAKEEAEARAAELRKAGNKQAAKEVLAEAKKAGPPPVEHVQVKPAIPKVSGIAPRVLWKFKVVDQSQIPRSFLEPNEVAIGSMVRLTKNKKIAEANCPGIEVWSEDSV